MDALCDDVIQADTLWEKLSNECKHQSAGGVAATAKWPFVVKLYNQSNLLTALIYVTT